ncbi:hypothetical protein BH09ACT1_BH09ACT1_23190 [soil metagenome]
MTTGLLTGSRPRKALAVAVALVPLVVLIAFGAVLSERLGPRIATHWSTGRYPDGFGSTATSLLAFAGITAALTVVAILVILQVRDGRAARTFAAITTIVAGMMALAWIVPALATLAASTPERATLGARMLLLLVAVGWGLLLVPVIPASARPDPKTHGVPPVGLSGMERVAWVGQAGSMAFAAVGGLVVLGCLVAGVLILDLGGPSDALWALGAGIVAGLGALLLARVRLSVDRRGVRLSSALLGIPLMRVPLAKVVAVSVEMIDPLSWGGWGFRFAPGRRAYVTGRAEGIVVTSSGGTFSAVTIPNAEGAASVLQALIRH